MIQFKNIYNNSCSKNLTKNYKIQKTLCGLGQISPMRECDKQREL